MDKNLPHKDTFTIEELALASMREIETLIRVLESEGVCTQKNVLDLIRRGMLKELGRQGASGGTDSTGPRIKLEEDAKNTAVRLLMRQKL